MKTLLTKEIISSNWKEFGLDTYLVMLRQYKGSFQQVETGETKHGFVHYPCPKGEFKAFGEGYGLYNNDTCERCGNVLPKTARESEGYVSLMNAVQKYGVSQ